MESNWDRVPSHLKDLAAAVPDLDTPVWYCGSLEATSTGEANTHWWERMRKRLRRWFA